MRTYFQHTPQIWENTSDNTEATYDTVCTVLIVMGPKDPPVGYIETDETDIEGKIYKDGQFYNDPSEIPE